MKQTCVGFWALALLALGGCIALDTKMPSKEWYALDVQRTGVQTNLAAVARGILRVNAFRAAPGMEDRGIGIRVDDVRRDRSSRYVFLAPPAALVGSQTRHWMADANLFSAVVDAGASASSGYELDGLVVEIGADLRNREIPKAVLELQVTLLDTRVGRNAAVMQKSYRWEEPIGETSASAIIRGLDAALAHVLVDVERDVRAAVR